MSIPIEWAETSKSKKGVRTIDNKACRIVVSSAYDKIWILDGAVNLKISNTKIKGKLLQWIRT